MTSVRRSSYWIALCGFLALASAYLWFEHQTHLLGALTYLILLACPMLHLFMHRGHGGPGSQDHREHAP